MKNSFNKVIEVHYDESNTKFVIDYFSAFPEVVGSSSNGSTDHKIDEHIDLQAYFKSFAMALDEDLMIKALPAECIIDFNEVEFKTEADVHADASHYGLEAKIYSMNDINGHIEAVYYGSERLLKQYYDLKLSNSDDYDWMIDNYSFTK